MIWLLLGALGLVALGSAKGGGGGGSTLSKFLHGKYLAATPDTRTFELVHSKQWAAQWPATSYVASALVEHKTGVWLSQGDGRYLRFAAVNDPRAKADGFVLVAAPGFKLT